MLWAARAGRGMHATLLGKSAGQSGYDTVRTVVHQHASAHAAGNPSQFALSVLALIAWRRSHCHAIKLGRRLHVHLLLLLLLLLLGLLVPATLQHVVGPRRLQVLVHLLIGLL